jgi:hypothetical protein
MANFPASRLVPTENPAHGARPAASRTERRRRSRHFAWKLAVLLPALLGAALVFAQAADPHVSAVDPTSGKVDDSATVSGQNLGKAAVTAVFLSDDKDDFKATVVSQADDKIEIKIPKVKAGPYNISVQVGDKLMIMPVRFTVQE